jgi:hypothetical protein
MLFTRKRLATAAAAAVLLALLASTVDPAALTNWVRGHLIITGNLTVQGTTNNAATSSYRLVMATPAAPTVVASQLGTDLAAGTYKITVVALDPGGGVTLAPAAVDCVITAGGAGRCAVTYAWPTGAVSMRIYTSAAGGATPDRYFATTKATLYNLDTLTGATVAALPATATAYRMLVGTGNTTNWFGLPILTTVPAIGATTTAGYTLQNPTAAAAAAQQYSPGFSQIGQGWKTDATAASQPVEVRWELRPVQGAAAPTYNYAVMGRINNAAWLDLYSITSTGVSSTASSIQTSGNLVANAGNVNAGAGNDIYFNTRMRFTSAADGVVAQTNNAATAGIRFQFAALPTIGSGFGTSPAITAGSTDTAGEVNVGTGGTATSGVITFATAWASAPFCTIQDSTSGLVQRAVPTTTTLTITSLAWTASDKLQWHCIGAK